MALLSRILVRNAVLMRLTCLGYVYPSDARLKIVLNAMKMAIALGVREACLAYTIRIGCHALPIALKNTL